MSIRLFVLERYDRAPGESVDEPVGALTTGVTRLRGAVRIPADDVVLALVEGPDAETVAAVAAAAGWRVDRLGTAEWIVEPESPATQPWGEES
ncbi:hypothetical protein D7147_15335 [Micromonospora musae]|uniref:Uncharacterized protein n=1 Tax=Micromonospora musae TaxID=1894970 RepID=A0A3A9YBH5_9ACTN|nr:MULTISPECIES: hypothetical protein [Micromonospora]RKN18798.1 hypothetical protein D7147_15335 [Micromonospora musae]RKN34610.1 hypothetical protein D7044_07225 [Micromonospora musae]TYB91631.1 hypothetical protein FXF53_29665 [Micromonospora sp. WP24]